MVICLFINVFLFKQYSDYSIIKLMFFYKKKIFELYLTNYLILPSIIIFKYNIIIFEIEIM